MAGRGTRAAREMLEHLPLTEGRVGREARLRSAACTNHVPEQVASPTTSTRHGRAGELRVLIEGVNPGELPGDQEVVADVGGGVGVIFRVQQNLDALTFRRLHSSRASMQAGDSAIIAVSLVLRTFTRIFLPGISTASQRRSRRSPRRSPVEGGRHLQSSGRPTVGCVARLPRFEACDRLLSMT